MGDNSKVNGASPGIKQTLILIVFAFTMLIVLLTYVSFLAAPGPASQMGPVGYAIGIAAILGSAFMTSAKLRPTVDIPARVFQQQMLICLATAEFGSLVGFMWHVSAGIPMWPLSAGSLAVILLLILPRLLAYLRLQDGDSGTRNL